MENENKNEEKPKKDKTKEMRKYAIIIICIIVIPVLIIGGVILKQNIDEKNRIATEEARLAAQIKISDEQKEIQQNNAYNADKTVDIENMQKENNNKYTKEQVISLLTNKKDSNEMPMIIEMGDLRLRTELNYIAQNELYVARYKYKVYDDMINFYIIVPQNIGGGYYNISAYEASYTITDDIVKYFNEYTNSENSNKRVNEIFKINKENYIKYYSYVLSETLNNYIWQTQEKASKILTYDPTGERQRKEAEESKERLIKQIKKDTELENISRDTNFEPTDEQMEEILKYFNYNINNYSELGYSNYVNSHHWFEVPHSNEENVDIWQSKYGT